MQESKLIKKYNINKIINERKLLMKKVTKNNK